MSSWGHLPKINPVYKVIWKFEKRESEWVSECSRHGQSDRSKQLMLTVDGILVVTGRKGASLNYNPVHRNPQDVCRAVLPQASYPGSSWGRLVWSWKACRRRCSRPVLQIRPRWSPPESWWCHCRAEPPPRRCCICSRRSGKTTIAAREQRNGFESHHNMNMMRLNWVHKAVALMSLNYGASPQSSLENKQENPISSQHCHFLEKVYK